MEAARYFIALALVVTLLPAMSMWLLIHPLARFWRRRGPAVSYLAVGAVVVLLAVVLFRWRASLLGVQYGFSWPLTIAGLAFVAVAILIERQYRRHLTAATLLGLPEVTERSPSRLITEGIYGKIRHPRYLGILFEITAFALFANYLASYVVVVATVPLLRLIVHLEERELLDRFGEEYERYMRQVPRFFPRVSPFGRG